MSSDNPVLELNDFKVPESNVFFMTRFREADYFKAVSDAVRDGVRAFGLEFLRADDPNLDGDILWKKIQNCLDACHFGVALFENIDDPDINPNVSLELGYMMGLNRRYLLLKEKRLRHLATDLVGHFYREFDMYNIRPSTLREIANWLKPIGVRKRDGERLIVFVSWGGVDRCAIAKVITQDLLLKHKFSLKEIRVDSRAAFSTTDPTASKAAVEVVKERLGKDWLSEHRPRRAGPAYLFEADLILATDREVLNKVRELHLSYPALRDDEREVVRDEIHQKLGLITKFFERNGDVEDVELGEDIDDPYNNFDWESEKAKEEYRKCFETLYNIISPNFSKLEKFLSKSPPQKDKVRTVAFGDTILYGTTVPGDIIF